MGGMCCGEYTGTHGRGPFFGRLLISLIFILAGIGKIIDFRGAVATLQAMGIHGAHAFVFIGMLMELVGGVLLVIGWYTRLAAIILMIFLLPTTLIFHGFWNYEGAEMAMQLSIFLRNLTIYGGLLLVLSYGPGQWSIDATRTKKEG